LLLYVAPGAGSQGVFTGKVFEYVAARRPVLALAPADNVAAALLADVGATSSSGGVRVDPDDVEQIAGALIAAWHAWREAGGPSGGRTDDIAVPDAAIERMDRATGAAQLAELLRVTRA